MCKVETHVVIFNYLLSDTMWFIAQS